MNCPQCNSNLYFKSGIINQKQRYTCKLCNFHYTVVNKSTAKPIINKRHAVQLYLSGLSLRLIGNYLKVSHVGVFKWLAASGINLVKFKSNKKYKLVKIEEILNYLKTKRSIPHRLLLLDLEEDLSMITWIDEEK